MWFSHHQSNQSSRRYGQISSSIIMTLSFARKPISKFIRSSWKYTSCSAVMKEEYLNVACSSAMHKNQEQSTRYMTTTSRPFQVLGLQQIAMGNVDKGSLSNLWTNIFGVQKIGSFKSEKENVDEDILRLGKEGSPHAEEIDLMMPIDKDKTPKVRVGRMKVVNDLMVLDLV